MRFIEIAFSIRHKKTVSSDSPEDTVYYQLQIAGADSLRLKPLESRIPYDVRETAWQPPDRLQQFSPSSGPI